MKWMILSGLFVCGIASADDNTATTTAPLPGVSDRGPVCRTPEGKEYRKGQTGYKSCINRKRNNREERQMPDFDNANTNMQMRH